MEVTTRVENLEAFVIAQHLAIGALASQAPDATLQLIDQMVPTIATAGLPFPVTDRQLELAQQLLSQIRLHAQAMRAAVRAATGQSGQDG